MNEQITYHRKYMIVEDEHGWRAYTTPVAVVLRSEPRQWSLAAFRDALDKMDNR